MRLRRISILLILLVTLDYGNGFSDNIFYFTSFKNPSQWDDPEGPYSTLCNRYTYDIFLEPRFQTQFNNLRAPREALSPIRIKTKDLDEAPTNVTLHIFNNPGVRQGYSVSYGFFRNKECLHGQDHFCITTPDFGRARAVVLNAERFPDNQNLNYIKDHFLIEDPEKFVSIINEGSKNERKFYEAVFLGGYPIQKDASRSSHWIDGKTYPLEIYMFFVDETTPSMSLTTILVVLVEESDRDNPYVKPIVSTVNNQLYESERKFLETTKPQKRTAKLYHHMQESTLYDVRSILNEETGTLIRQMTLTDSVRTEDLTTAFFEAFEQMEGVSSDLYFLDEDRDYTFAKQNELHEKIDKFNTYKAQDVYYPFDNNCTYVVFYTAIHKVAQVYSVLDPFANTTCEFGTDFIYEGSHKLMSPRVLCRFNMCTQLPPAPNSSEVDYSFTLNKNFAPWVEERSISIDVCKYLVEWSDLIDEGYEDLIFNLTTIHKYKDIQVYIELRKKSALLNTRLLKYILNYRNYTDFVNKPIPRNLMKGLEQLMLDIRKRAGYRNVLKQTDEAIDAERSHQNFPDRKSMRDILHFMKFGSHNYGMRFKRPHIQTNVYNDALPEHHKKRGYMEYGNLEIPEDKVLEDIKRSPKKAIISQAFQISWLIPPNGGYYIYEGSSPLPPCYRALSVIVFKKPITMSRSQIQALSRIPLSFKKIDDIKSTHPVIHDPEFTVNLQSPPDGEIRFEEVKVPVHFQKRNHLFLGFDGVNRNAVEQSEKFENVDKAGSYKFIAGIRLIKSVLLLHFPVNMILTLRAL